MTERFVSNCDAAAPSSHAQLPATIKKKRGESNEGKIQVPFSGFPIGISSHVAHGRAAFSRISSRVRWRSSRERRTTRGILKRLTRSVRLYAIARNFANARPWICNLRARCRRSHRRVSLRFNDPDTRNWTFLQSLAVCKAS